MRIPAPLTVSALVVAGLVATGSTTNTTEESTAPQAAEALLAASGPIDGAEDIAQDDPESRTVGLLSVTPESPRALTASTPPADGVAPANGAVPLSRISLPGGGGALGIPEIVLAAYRNAELAMQSAAPDCALPWNLLAGIGRIESGHASGGRTDAAGTTSTPIFGPALDGTLPGNEVIRAEDGGYVRAVGPMQFLPSTWSRYAADGNGDGVSDPHNVFDATLAAGKYLCAGGTDMNDPAQQLRAVLRYNNSMSYAASVLSWSAAYRSGATPAPTTVSPGLVPPGQTPLQANPDLLASQRVPLPVTPAPDTPSVTQKPQAPAVITIPGLPPIPCGVLCPPPPPDPCAAQANPVPAPTPDDPAKPPVVSIQTFGLAAPPAAPATQSAEPAPGGPGTAGTTACPAPDTAAGQHPAQPTAPTAPAPDAPAEAAPTQPAEPEIATPPEPAPAPPVQPPAITLPFGIVIPLPPQG